MELTVNGARISYDLIGQGPALTLVHSIGLSTRQGWRDQVPVLAPRFTVLSYDIRGLGESEAGTAPLGVDTFVDDLAHLLGALQVERTVLMGVSLGGVIAACMAARHPDVVSALVLVSAVVRASPGGARRMLERNRNIAAHGMAVAVDEQVRSHFSPDFLAARPEIEEWYRATYVANEPANYMRIMDHLSRLDISEDLAGIGCPTLVIAGEDDEPSVTGSTPLAAARALQQRIGGARLHAIPGSRHYPQLDSADEFNRAVLEFLASIGD